MVLAKTTEIKREGGVGGADLAPGQRRKEGMNRQSFGRSPTVSWLLPGLFLQCTLWLKSYQDREGGLRQRESQFYPELAKRHRRTLNNSKK